MRHARWPALSIFVAACRDITSGPDVYRQACGDLGTSGAWDRWPPIARGSVHSSVQVIVTLTRVGRPRLPKSTKSNTKINMKPIAHLVGALCNLEAQSALHSLRTHRTKRRHGAIA